METERPLTFLLFTSDDPGTIGAVAENLDYEEFSLIIVRKIHNFIQVMEKRLPGLLLLDVQVHFGAELWRYLQEKPAGVPVLLITPRDAGLEPALKDRVDEILYKPLDPLEMNNRLAGLKRIVEMERQLPGRKPAFAGTGRVLLVEDSAVQRRILARQLEQQQFEVHVAADGEEVLRVAGQVAPDVVLLDLMLPGLNGIEVCRRLKNHPQTADIPVIFITSSQSVEEKIKALECGAHDFLVKPVNPQELFIRIRSLLRQRQLLATLSVQASKDPLTGLDNRRQLMEALRNELRRAVRYCTPLSLLMLDVDHFKAYNDTHGHPAGDEVLRRLARLLEQNIRTYDRVARYGGEEFVVLLPHTDPKGAFAVAEKLRLLVERTSFPGEETQPEGRLTVSIGVASFPDHASQEDALLAAADRALYAAKAAGRNRVAAAGGAG
ncbi:MAG: diguanylate cyclase [Desulfotomaculales bacterium]